MATPQSTPIRQAKLGIASSKSMPLTNEYKKLLSDQHQRLAIKHQQDLDLIDDIRSYVKARLSIEKDYTSALNKLAKSHSSHINKKFTLLNQCDPSSSLNLNNVDNNNNNTISDENNPSQQHQQQQQYRFDPPDRPFSLYKVWSEHINRLQVTSKNRSDQFEQLILIVDKLKDIRSHKALIGKKCLDTHLKRIHEDLMVSMVELERARKLYNEDESQAKKARENEEKFKKKRSGLLTKFTDLQAKKEKTSAQREATDIQSTQARNDYIMALAAANAHLKHYYHRDLNDFVQLIDDGVLDHCKIFMATLSECDINSLKDSLQHAQYWSKLINSTGSQQTNYIFLDCQQSVCLRPAQRPDPLAFEPYNNDPIQAISLEHNADYALQHEIDKWFTWFKKECRNLSQLMLFLDTCQHAFTEGKKSIEWNGQTVENLESQIIELKQQIRKSEAAKLKAQARLKVIKEGGMQIEEWSSVELEIRADMARAQEEALRARRAKEMASQKQSTSSGGLEGARSADNDDDDEDAVNHLNHHHHHHQQQQQQQQASQVQLQISKDSELDSDEAESTHNLASVSRSTSNLMQKQQNAISGYSALTDPSLVWQDDAWSSQTGTQQAAGQHNQPLQQEAHQATSGQQEEHKEGYGGLLSTKNHHQQSSGQQPNTSVSIQSSSPLSAIVNNQHLSNSPYQAGMMSEAYKSDYECDYNTRNGHLMMRSSAASSADLPPTSGPPNGTSNHHLDPFGKPLDELTESFDAGGGYNNQDDDTNLLNRRVVGLYNFEKNNDDDLAFSENDVLLIVELVQDDPNWLRARNEATGAEGFIPASYVRPVDADDNNNNDDDDQFRPATETNDEAWTDNQAATTTGNMEEEDDDDRRDVNSVQYCRALYDHQPDADTFEEDGLPHLSLAQGELFKIIDQGEDDGWWLVEKCHSGVRGHVPSMLVEEVDEEEDNFDGDEDDGSGTEMDADELGSTPGPPPDFEPPKLEAPHLEEAAEEIVDRRANQQAEREAEEKSTTTNSLVPTSFIIIEPTPEVESRRIEDDLKANEDDAQQASKDPDTTAQENDSQSNKPSSNSDQPAPPVVSYSVINEDFVLERPTRKPHQFSQSVAAHETPTIMEAPENEQPTGGMTDIDQRQVELTSPGANYEPLSEVDSVGDSTAPAPPSVVIDSFEEEPRERSADGSEADEQEQAQSADQSDQDAASDYDQQQQQPQGSQRAKKIKHTGNVDISPILRHRADEFSRQIIEEAIMLAPGADIGPSTSSASASPVDNTDEHHYDSGGDDDDEDA